MNKFSTHHGACLCGEMQFSATQTHGASACHCSMCRKHNGALFHTMPCKDFIVHKGAEYLAVYPSSQWAERGFCRQCSSSIFYRTQDQAFYGVSLGCINAPKPKLSQHIYVDCADVDENLQPAIWDDLPRQTKMEFLASMGLAHLYDHQTPAIADPNADTHHGGCMCGGVRFHTTGALDSVLICHCGQCNIQASSFYRATNVHNSALHFDKDSTLRWYTSSDTAERGFCGDCGSKLFWRGTASYRQDIDAKMSTSILMGAFDERLALPLHEHIYTQDASGAYPLA